MTSSTLQSISNSLQYAFFLLIQSLTSNYASPSLLSDCFSLFYCFRPLPRFSSHQSRILTINKVFSLPLRECGHLPSRLSSNRPLVHLSPFSSILRIANSSTSRAMIPQQGLAYIPPYQQFPK